MVGAAPLAYRSQPRAASSQAGGFTPLFWLVRKDIFPLYTVIWVKLVVLPSLAGIRRDRGIFLRTLQHRRSSFAVKCACCCSWGKTEFGLYKRYCRAAINLLAVGSLGVPKGISLLLETDKCM